MLALAAAAVLEARRTRLAWFAGGLALLLLSGSLFARSLALTEAHRLQLALLAPAVRLAAVGAVCLHVLASLVREAQDRTTEYLLAVDLSRTEYLLGKALGYLAVATLACTVLWLPLAALAPWPAALAWLASLVLECWIVAAAALFCAVSLRQVLAGAGFVLGAYLLARWLAAVQLTARASPFTQPGPLQDALEWLLQGLALLLPGLDRFTPTAWLLEAAPGPDRLAGLALEAMISSAVLLAAALVDLYRRED